jgi:phosphoribosyl 1,2-cyclic phosphodiesterase
MAFFVRFWGTRGSIPTPGPAARKYGGNTTCVEVRWNNTLFICDAGTGIRELGLDLETRGTHPIVGHLLFSHTHWDHIQGFPFFPPAYDPANTFYVYGLRAGDVRTYDLLSGQMTSDYFPVDFKQLKSRVLPDHLDEGKRTIDGVAIDFIEQTHQGKCYAYAFRKDGCKVVFATDNELDLQLTDLEQPIRDPDAPRALPKAMIEFCRDADLLICDGQYFDDEYAMRVGWGHPRATTVVDLAIAAGVKQLAITHHDPMQSDQDVERKIALCKARVQQQQSSVVVFGAREGLELRFGPASS